MVDIGIMNEYCNLGNMLIRNRELEWYGDKLAKDKEKELVLLSLNVNGLQSEGWKVKIDIIKEFLIKYKVDIIAF